jgi:hypothetical protein
VCRCVDRKERGKERERWKSEGGRERFAFNHGHKSLPPPLTRLSTPYLQLLLQASLATASFDRKEKQGEEREKEREPERASDRDLERERDHPLSRAVSLREGLGFRVRFATGGNLAGGPAETNLH